MDAKTISALEADLEEADKNMEAARAAWRAAEASNDLAAERATRSAMMNAGRAVRAARTKLALAELEVLRAGEAAS